MELGNRIHVFRPYFGPQQYGAKDLLNLMTSSPVATGLAHHLILSNFLSESDVQLYCYCNERVIQVVKPNDMSTKLG